MSERNWLKSIIMEHFIISFFCRKISSVWIKGIINTVNPNVIYQWRIESIGIHLGLIEVMNIITLLFCPKHCLTLELNSIDVDPHPSPSSHEKRSDTCKNWRNNSSWVCKPRNSLNSFISSCFLLTFLCSSSFRVFFWALSNTLFCIQQHPVPITAFCTFGVILTINFIAIRKFCNCTFWANKFISVFTVSTCHWIPSGYIRIGT